MKNKRFGFTLIEILIVIAIIAVLASAVLIGLGPVQRQGRDARRISDLRQVQNALELYFAKCGYYPGTTQSGSTCGSFSQITTWTDLSTALQGSNVGVTQVPKDPTSGKNYFYGTDSSGVTYTIGATLEDTNNSAFQNSPRGTINGVNCDPPNYCIQF
jgi:prepilin-type N-terminal cleavage/methylation domain-containing protein